PGHPEDGRASPDPASVLWELPRFKTPLLATQASTHLRSGFAPHDDFHFDRASQAAKPLGDAQPGEDRWLAHRPGIARSAPWLRSLGLVLSRSWVRSVDFTPAWCRVRLVARGRTWSWVRFVDFTFVGPLVRSVNFVLSSRQIGGSDGPRAGSSPRTAHDR